MPKPKPAAGAGFATAAWLGDIAPPEDVAPGQEAQAPGASPEVPGQEAQAPGGAQDHAGAQAPGGAAHADAQVPGGAQDPQAHADAQVPGAAAQALAPGVPPPPPGDDAGAARPPPPPPLGKAPGGVQQPQHQAPGGKGPPPGQKGAPGGKGNWGKGKPAPGPRGQGGNRPFVPLDYERQHPTEIALQSLDELGHPGWEAANEARLRIIGMAGCRWWHLRPTLDPHQWQQVLLSLGADQKNIDSLSHLVRSYGASGQAEASRLMWTWLQPKASGSHAYVKSDEVFQKSINNAKKALERDPQSSKDWRAWHLGNDMGGYWKRMMDERLLPLSLAAGPLPSPPPVAPGAYCDLKTGDTGYPSYVPGQRMSNIAPGGWWTEGWWQAADGSWRYRSYG